jgi:hypothetical protein
MLDAYPEDHNLVLHTLIYTAYDVQYNCCNETLFGARIWDPYHVASTIGFASKTLLNKVAPERRRELANVDRRNWDAYIAKQEADGYPMWDTTLCNAIYILMEQSKIESYTTFDKDSRSSVLKRVQIFDQAEKRRTKRNKIFYELRYSAGFVKSLVKNFSRFDLDVLVKLPYSCRILYLGLMNARDIAAYKMQQTNVIEFSPSLNTLYKWANCRQKVQRENMRELKAKLEQINQVERMVSHRQEEEPPYVFARLDKSVPFIRIQYSAAEMEQKKKDNEDRFHQMLLLNLKAGFRVAKEGVIRAMVTPEEFPRAFSEWLFNLDVDFEPKMKALEETYMMVYGNTDHYENNRWAQYKQVIPELRFRVNPEKFEIVEPA